MEEPYWLEDFLAAGHVMNRDGTVDLYHGTTKEKAAQMVQQQRMLTASGATAAYGVYLSTSPKIGVEGGYGDGSVVKIRCRIQDLEIDDQFPDGRMDFSVQKKMYRPVKISLAESKVTAGFRQWLEQDEGVTG